MHTVVKGLAVSATEVLSKIVSQKSAGAEKDVQRSLTLPKTEQDYYLWNY